MPFEVKHFLSQSKAHTTTDMTVGCYQLSQLLYIKVEHENICTAKATKQQLNEILNYLQYNTLNKI